MQSGIYEILNTITLIRYIGSAKYLKKRLGDHKTNLKYNRHANRHLQASYNKHGLESFEFNIIEYCNVNDLLVGEQKHIDSYKFKSLYNLRPKASNNLGLKMSDESKQRQSEAHKKAGRNSGNFNKGQIAWNKGKKLPPSWNAGTTGLMNIWNKGTKGLTSANKTSFKPKGEIRLVSNDNILYITTLGAVFLSKQIPISSGGIYNILKGIDGNKSGFRLPIEGEIYTQTIEFKPQTKS